MPKTADIVVVGGGINGCSTAYHLARRGARNIVLIEKGHVASGPTGRSSGIVRQHYKIKSMLLVLGKSIQNLKLQWMRYVLRKVIHLSKTFQEESVVV